MQKIIITENQLNKLIAILINEGMSAVGSSGSMNNNKGAVVVKKTTNPMDIKKLTDKGLNVSLIDEKLNEEQPILYKHRFEKGALQIFITKDKGKTQDILKYISEIKEQDKVNKAFESKGVILNVKEASSGRYKESGKMEKKLYDNFVGMSNYKHSRSTNKKNEQPENLKEVTGEE